MHRGGANGDNGRASETSSAPSSPAYKRGRVGDGSGGPVGGDPVGGDGGGSEAGGGGGGRDTGAGVPNYVALVTEDGFKASGGADLLEIFGEDHELTRKLVSQIKRFVHAGNGTWFIRPSGPGFMVNGGLIGVWNANDGDALRAYLCRMAKSVL